VAWVSINDMGVFFVYSRRQFFEFGFSLFLREVNGMYNMREEIDKWESAEKYMVKDIDDESKIVVCDTDRLYYKNYILYHSGTRNPVIPQPWHSTVEELSYLALQEGKYLVIIQRKVREIYECYTYNIRECSYEEFSEFKRLVEIKVKYKEYSYGDYMIESNALIAGEDIAMFIEMRGPPS
jgi:hypothetical protein